MTHIGSSDDGRSRRFARRGFALTALALALGAPAVVGADADGRAEWRTPDARRTPAAVARGNTPPALGRIGPQALVAGRPWRLHVRARDPDGGVPGLLVRDLPDDARLSAERGGWHRLDWTPPVGTTGDIDLTIVAVDALDERLRSERVIRLEVRAAERPPVPPVATSGDDPAVELEEEGEPPSEPTATLPDPPSPRPLAPLIEPLASQIVSAGRTVSFRVAATLAEATLEETSSVERSVPLLQIDRLPRNASFDVNPDGSRTFRWPTGDRDQGEHRFRITALHPDDERLRSRVDLFVIIGDPTRSVTEPLDEEGAIGARSTEPPSGSPAADPRVRTADPGPRDRPPPGALDDERPVSPEDEPFLPQASSGEEDYFASDDGGADGFPVDPYGENVDPSSYGPGDPFLETDDPFRDGSEPGYFDDGGGVPLGPDGQPLDP